MSSSDKEGVAPSITLSASAKNESPKKGVELCSSYLKQYRS